MLIRCSAAAGTRCCSRATSVHGTPSPGRADAIRPDSTTPARVMSLHSQPVRTLSLHSHPVDAPPLHSSPVRKLSLRARPFRKTPPCTQQVRALSPCTLLVSKVPPCSPPVRAESLRAPHQKSPPAHSEVLRLLENAP